MKRFCLGVLAKVLYILLSCMQLSEAQDVSNAVCKWNTSTSTCQQDQQGLIDLLTEAGERHTFALFMTCQYVSDKSQCNNLSTCVWENRACRISSKKLVTEINTCFNTDWQQEKIIPCKNELVSISNSTTWINEDSTNSASSCQITVGYFLSYRNTCRLMKNALQCGGGYSPYCEQASSISNQAYQFVSDLRYVMNVPQLNVSLQLQYLESNLDIRARNLEEYFYCSLQDQQECEGLPPLPSPPPPPSEPQIVSNAVCKWNNSTSTCQQDQQGLMDLLTEAGEAHPFSLFMRCQYVSSKSQCNNLSTCVWENRACRISSKKLVAQINSCFREYTQQYSINPCKNELLSIYYSTTWINQHSLNPASSCRQAVGFFSFGTNTCILMEHALHCEERYSFRCEQASSISNQAYQFVSNLRYVMNVPQLNVSLTFPYLEEYLDIRVGNLEEYFYCSLQDLQECEELPPLPSPPPTPSEAKIVSNAVCKWNNSTSTCQQDQQGLVDLLTQAGEAHIFSLFMTCQYVSQKSQCNNLSTCVWENGSCRISSKKLVTEINSCFYTSSYDYSIILCKNELIQIYYSTTWINQHSLNPASSCRQAVGFFSFGTNTCILMQYALQCGGLYSSSTRCKQASSISNQAYQFVSDLRYVMNVSQQDVSLQLQYLEEYLDIRVGNLEEYFRCSSQDQQECEELPPLPSPPPSRQKNVLSGGAIVGFGAIVGIVFGVLILGLCCAQGRINERIQAQNSRLRWINATSQNTAQAQNLELVQINGNSQNTAQNQVARIETADIIGALPSLEFMDVGENRSEQVCVICLEGLKEGEVSTVLPCAHWFHKKCIESWIINKGSNVTCPLCNHPVSQQNHI